MGQETGIAWTHHTANFWMGCQRVSPGCEHCYAETLVTGRMGLPVWGPASTTERKRAKGVWRDVPAWNRAALRDGVRRRVFVSSLADIFEEHPQVAPWRAEALALLEQCTALDVQLLTKRPENIMSMVPAHWRTAWPSHVWVGTTVEDQKRAEQRIPHLLMVPARVRFLSCEPLIEAVNLTRVVARRIPGVIPGEVVIDGLRGWCGSSPDEDTPAARGLQWVIVGGESGHDARTFDVAWARSIVFDCREAGVPVFVKQMGDRPTTTLPPTEVWPTHCPTGKGAQFHGDGFGNYRVRGLAHHGANPSEWPPELRVQEFPAGVGRGANGPLFGSTP